MRQASTHLRYLPQAQRIALSLAFTVSLTQSFLPASNCDSPASGPHNLELELDFRVLRLLPLYRAEIYGTSISVTPFPNSYQCAATFMAKPLSIPGPTRSSTPGTLSFFVQRLGDIDLFNNLIFNRERVYESFKRLSPIRTHTIKEEESAQYQLSTNDDCSLSAHDFGTPGKDSPGKDTALLLRCNNIDMAVTRSRERSTKAKPAKAKPKGASRTSVPRPAKRSASAVSKDERAPKARKIVPKANSGKRVNGRGASIADAISISDDDNGAEKPQRSNIVSIKLPKRILQLSNLVNEDELNQEPSGKADLEHMSLQTDAAHEKDLQHLQQQLAAAKAKIMELQHDAEWKAISLIRQQDIAINKQRAELEEALEAERAGLSDRSWECAQLHRELEAERSRLKGESTLIQERDEYERLYKEGQDINTKLLRSLQERDEESVRNLTRSAGEIRNLTAQLSSLQGELSQLKQESAFLETPSPPSQQPFTTRSTTSPSPPLSQSSSPTDTRLANIRKTYITVKRQYDCLRSIAMNISTATRSWDCNGFGEFGGYLKQLRVVLQESGREGEMHGRKVTGGGGVGKVE